MWNVEARVFAFSSVRRSIVGDVEGEMTWIWSDVCGVWTVGDWDWGVGIVGVENVEPWIWVLM